MTTTDLYGPAQHVEHIEECYFYHVMEIPGHGLVGNDWDLRAGVDAYLGEVNLKDQRVLEIGPASGFLTFFMESRGATVVCVELASRTDWDIVPHVLIDRDAITAERRAVMEQLRNGFWFAHERLRSHAVVHYGSAYELPSELGHFDTAVLGSVLLHTRDPLRVIEECAARSDRLIITERHLPELDGSPVCRLYPTPHSSQWDTWWEFSPEMIARFLEVIGFERHRVTYHDQTHIYPGGNASIPMFTVVAERAT